MYRGEVIVADDFNAPMPPQLLALFRGEPIPPATNSVDNPPASKRRRTRWRKSRATRLVFLRLFSAFRLSSRCKIL
jgi:hypothetical protein